ncbi:MAG: ATP-binding cassette domain-containing protein [Lachnospiraceae bacterium]
MELRLENITFGYGKTNVIEHMDLVLTPGVYGLLGPNGAGKSTLISLIVGNRISQQGEILWNGKDIRKEGIAYRSIIGYKPQQQSIYPEFRVTEFLHYMSALKNIQKKQANNQIEELLQKLNLNGCRNKKLKALSGGMLQRVLLAQALLGEPELIILDEPTAGLDPMERINMRQLIRETAKDKIVLLATHIIEDIGTIAKEIIFMNHGKILLKGDMKQLREYYEKGKQEGRMRGVEMQDEIMILENLYDDLFRGTLL